MKIWICGLLSLVCGIIAGAKIYDRYCYKLPQTIGTYLDESPKQKLDTVISVMTNPHFSGKYDIATFNLLCALDLPGAESIDIEAFQKQLDEWASHVAIRTEYNMYKFRENPGSFNFSEAYFRALMLVCIVQDEYKIHYDPTQIKALSDFTPEDIRHSENMFIHGPLGKKRMGTCSNLPVLYIAIGRRLGYPMYLVTTTGHLFTRWESADGKVRFNIEGTGHGMGTHTDEDYKKWPVKITAEDAKQAGFLKSMNPIEELACFLMLRADVLMAEKRYAEAQACLSYSHYLLPELPIYQQRFMFSLVQEFPWWNKNLILLDPSSRKWWVVSELFDPKIIKSEKHENLPTPGSITNFLEPP